MRTRRSPHNQMILWRALGGRSIPSRPPRRTPLMSRTEARRLMIEGLRRPAPQPDRDPQSRQ